jgi:GntR family transcriptional regulator, transcriptional repressor for pyruvate dehydrogenase complex
MTTVETTPPPSITGTPAEQPAGKGSRRSRRVYSTVLAALQAGIQQGRWAPGERLPSISALAKEFQVGTGSVREALQSLQSIGRVRIEHGRGVFVTAAPPEAAFPRQVELVSAGQLVALAETRRILEPELAALAAERGTEAELAAIKALARQMEVEAAQDGDFAELDVAFHLQIAHAARNPILDLTITGVSATLLESRRDRWLPPDSKMRSAQYHALIAEALNARDAGQVRLLMQAHMNDMMRDVLATEARAQLTGE